MDRKVRRFQREKSRKVMEKKQRLKMMHNEMMSVEQQIQLAANNKLYSNKGIKGIRIITVICYFFSISLVAIILSSYYIFYWQPEYRNTTTIRINNCGKLVH